MDHIITSPHTSVDQNESDIFAATSEFLPPVEHPALRRLIDLGALDIVTAHELTRELSSQANAAEKHRDTNRRANHGYLSNRGANTPHRVLSKLELGDLSYSGTAEDASLFVYYIDQLAQLRFAEQSHDVYRGNSRVSFDFTHVDQNGDWDAPNDLDEIVEGAIDPENLRYANMGDVNVLVRRHPRTHPRLSYSFSRAHEQFRDRHAVTVVRKRPYADIILSGTNREPTKIELFRKSWFVVSMPYDGDVELFDAIGKAKHGQQLSSAHEMISEYVDSMLVDPNKRSQSYVLPCTVGYVAQVRDPRGVSKNYDS